MLVLGILLLLLGAISGFVAPDRVVAGITWDMNAIGWILFMLGIVSIVLGVWIEYMYGHWHSRHDEVRDVTFRDGDDDGNVGPPPRIGR